MRRVPVFLTLLAWTSLAGPVRAGGGDGAEKPALLKAPSPGVALQTIVRNFSKAKNYRVKVDVLGGYSTAEDHAVGQAMVREAYAGEVNGGLMNIPSAKVFRTLKKGAVFIDGTWKDILSDRRTVRIERLFKFPDVILGSALKNASRAVWLAPDPVVATADDIADDGATEYDPDLKPSGEGAAEKARSGKKSTSDKKPTVPRTVVFKKSKDAGKAALAALPRVIRVEAPPEEALKHIIEVQNSNCFGVG
ncbi:MAG TPA: hypothetical protein VMT52_01720 [Planctomycetota bacterium]|nr:hypothetical protein [Planctomycetota bacterium]